MIDLASGEIWLLGNQVCVRPRMALREFQASPMLSVVRQNLSYDERESRQYVSRPIELLGANFQCCFCFTPDTLTMIQLFPEPRNPDSGIRKLFLRFGLLIGMSARESEAAASEDKAFNDQWLERAVGQTISAKYYPPWGEILSEYDQERCGAWITIQYS